MFPSTPLVVGVCRSLRQQAEAGVRALRAEARALPQRQQDPPGDPPGADPPAASPVRGPVAAHCNGAVLLGR